MLQTIKRITKDGKQPVKKKKSLFTQLLKRDSIAYLNRFKL